MDSNAEDKEEAAAGAPPGGGDPPSLNKLLSALALGVRAVNALPAPPSNADGGDHGGVDSEDNEDDGDDEFAYRMAFPEFASLCHEGREVLSGLLSESLGAVETASDDEDEEGAYDEGRGAGGEKNSVSYGFDDPILWERAAEACDSLLESVDAYVQSARDGSSDVVAVRRQREVLEGAAARARDRAGGGYRMMMDGLVDMEKPQITYDFAGTVNNSRHEPFVPPVHPDKPHGTAPLSETLRPRPGHGLETRNGDFVTPGSAKIPDDVVAPDVHYPHQYEGEVRSLQYRDWQLRVESDGVLGKHGLGGTLNRDGDGVPTARGLWIDAEADLERLARRIEGTSSGEEAVREVAVDLEAHSHRSFGGFVCLMQISLRRRRGGGGGERKDGDAGKQQETIETASDFLVDTISLRRVLNRHLAPMFANPDIVKVMHGADSDIPWLQRDFGIYVVNLFDTGRAARALPHFSSAGLAYLLGRYAGVEADKKHQLSDWRQRPLPDDMAAYATSDTTYLLDIYDRIKLDLEACPDPAVSVRSVLDESKKVCLIRYDKEPFKPSGYKTLVNSKRGKRKRTANGSSSSSSLDPRLERVLKELYDWRDRTARDQDESLPYVCPNSALVRIATMCPRTVGALQGLVNPCPPLVVRYSDEVLAAIKQASSAEGTAASKTTKPVTSSPEKISQLRASASPFAFFKPATEGGGAAGQPRASPASAGSGGVGDRDLPPRPPSVRSNAGILSPVVGTEALFKQAGWMTPQGDPAAAGGSEDAPMEEGGGVDTTTTEDESDGGGVGGKKTRRHLLEVDGANENYVATRYTGHSLEMGSLVDEEEVGGEKTEGDAANNKNNRRGRTVDGLGAAREALDGKNEPSVERGTEAAKESAGRIRADLASGRHGVLSLASRPDAAASGFGDGAEVDAGGSGAARKDASGGTDVAVAETEDEEEDYTIPRSMREIYQISNRNRRGTKATAPAPLATDGPVKTLDVDSIDGAEALLASRGSTGKGYFGGTSGDASADDGRSKRQRTRQQEEAIEALGAKCEDASLIAEVGWIKDEAEAVEMMAERGGDEGADGATVDVGRGSGGSVPEDSQDSGGSAAPSNKSKKRGGKGGGQQRAQGGQAPSGQQQPQDAAPQTFDYSRVGSIGAYGPRGAPALSNPFFGGAAVGAGTLSGQQQATDRKKGGPGGAKGKNKGGSGSGERPGRRDGGSKTVVYRR